MKCVVNREEAMCPLSWEGMEGETEGEKGEEGGVVKSRIGHAKDKMQLFLPKSYYCGHRTLFCVLLHFGDSLSRSFLMTKAHFD